jgi:hypothetical protein
MNLRGHLSAKKSGAPVWRRMRLRRPSASGCVFKEWRMISGDNQATNLIRNSALQQQLQSRNGKRPEQTWSEYVSGLVWEKGNLDIASYDACLRAASLGVTSATAIEEIAQRIRAAGDYPRIKKIESQWRRAAIHVRLNPSVPVERRPAFNPGRAKTFAGRIPSSVDFRWLKQSSPIPTRVTPAEYLSAVFDVGHQILIFTDPRSQGQSLYKNQSTTTQRNTLGWFVTGHKEGVWFLSNPVDGQYHFNPRQGKMSRRSEESVTVFRHAVLESDAMAAEEWLRILVQLPLPIVSITSSGGRSLHALLRLEAKSKAGWDQLVRGLLLPRLVPLGADPQALTAVRLTRLPNCYRGGQLQELLYLNPKASLEPIFQR